MIDREFIYRAVMSFNRDLKRDFINDERKTLMRESRRVYLRYWRELDVPNKCS